MAGTVFFEDIAEGSEVPPLVKKPTLMQLVKFAGATGDYHPIHYDQEFARARGLPDVIVHGWLVLAFLGQMVTDWMGEGGTLAKLAGSYRGMSIVDEDIFCYGRVIRKYVEDGDSYADLDIWAENPRGEKTTTGSAVVVLPSCGE
jgi:acyl dehydratase